MIYESQLIKSIYHEDYIVEIKEEIIEVDEKTKQLLKYCVVVERAKHSLYDLYSMKMTSNLSGKAGLWFDEEFQRSHLEKFSVQKFLYYYFQTIQGLNYLHSKGIIYMDMKP